MAAELPLPESLQYLQPSLETAASLGLLDTLDYRSLPDVHDGFGQPASEPLAAALAFPTGCATGLDGDLYVADCTGHRVLRIDPQLQVIENYAGLANEAGPPVDDAERLAARLAWPRALAVGGDGAVFVAESANAVVRRISGDHMTRILGNGQSGTPDGTVATAASIGEPTGVVVDANGRVVVSDGAGFIYRVDGERLEKVAGTGARDFRPFVSDAQDLPLIYPTSIAIREDDQSLLVTDEWARRVVLVTSEGDCELLVGGDLDDLQGVPARYGYFVDESPRAAIFRPGSDAILVADWASSQIVEFS